MQQETEIFASEGLSNIFNGNLVQNNAANSSQQYKVIGYRLQSVYRENINVIAKSLETPEGIYQGTTFLNGVRRKGCNADGLFFPKDWTRENVIDAISEAYQNKILKNADKQIFKGETSSGMKIDLWLDENEKVTDAMPFREHLPKKRKKRSKVKHCKQCGQPKHYICQTHHNFKKQGFAKIYSKIRRCWRKIYFAFAVKLGFAENR